MPNSQLLLYPDDVAMFQALPDIMQRVNELLAA